MSRSRIAIVLSTWLQAILLSSQFGVIAYMEAFQPFRYHRDLADTSPEYGPQIREALFDAVLPSAIFNGIGACLLLLFALVHFRSERFRKHIADTPGLLLVGVGAALFFPLSSSATVTGIYLALWYPPADATVVHFSNGIVGLLTCTMLLLAVASTIELRRRSANVSSLVS